MSTASFKGFDIKTSGNWPSKYGSNGYVLCGNNICHLSSNITINHNFNINSLTWALTTTDPRALPISSDPIAIRYAGCLYTWNSATININITDGNTYQLTVYALDWNQTGWQGNYQIIDADTNQILDTQTILRCKNGAYLIWNISGNINLVINRNYNCPNPIGISGIFFDKLNLIPTRVLLSVNTNPAVSNQEITLIATVIPASGSVTPTGTVTFIDKSTTPPTILGVIKLS